MSLGESWKSALDAKQSKQAGRGGATAAEQRARRIIDRLPSAIERETSRGSSDVRIMKLSGDEFTDQSFIQPLRRNTLRGAACIVYDYCVREGLELRVCGDGMSGTKPPVEMWASPKRA